MENTNNIANPMESGLITKIWGPHMWVALHSISFCYPLNPTEQDKKKFYSFFRLVGDMLPCFHCRESYNNFIKCGITKLDDSVFISRESVTKWLYYLHEAVNKKLGVDYGVSYEDVVIRYESYRASCNKNDMLEKITSKGCDAPLDKKTISYRIENTKECPIIPIKMAKHFIKYARMRGLDDDEFKIINQFNGNYKENIELWNTRNIECNNIVKNMRLQGIKSIELDDKWKDLPTIEELKLIMRLSSNLSNDKLIEIIKKLPNCNCEYQKIYKLIN